jgi:hypothetical protein
MFGHPSNDRPTLLNFRDRTPNRTDRGAIELLTHTYTQYHLLINVHFQAIPDC